MNNAPTYNAPTYAEEYELLAYLRQFEKTELLEELRSLDPIVFERLIAALFTERGFTATTTTASGDEGVDVFLRRGNESAVVQCKRYESSVGQPVVRDLFGTMIHHEANDAYLVTTGTVTRQASDWAFGKPIHLIDGYGLVKWILDTRPAGRSASASGGSRRTWMWPAVLAGALVFGFVVAVAFLQIAGRLRPDEGPPATNPPPTVADAGTPDAPGVVATDGTTEPVAVISTTTPVATPPTATVAPPTATPTPCAVVVDGNLADLYTRESLGCPVSEAQIVWAAWEPFERGYMLWRSDTDASYAFYDNGQRTWLQIEIGWDGGELPSRGAPPPGLFAPERGFGYVWSVRDDLFQSLGWATDIERGFCAQVQTFANGEILKSATVPSCTADNLYNQANASDWTPVALAISDGGMWDSSALAPVISSAPASGGSDTTGGSSAVADAPAADGQTRPQSQGIFRAASAGSIVMDGDAGEWGGTWYPVGALVQGSDHYNGSADLSGEFQVQWSSEGLYLAVRVRDEQYSAGPGGTDMWQGDGLEIHLDGQLAADFANAQADGDDYQLGVSFGPNLNQILVYRWLPYDQESALGMDGWVQTSLDGYELESLVPWRLFGLRNDSIASGATFGFNVSVNDNDGATPAQQTVISASPARTTFDDPTEWGTLILE